MTGGEQHTYIHTGIVTDSLPEYMACQQGPQRDGLRESADGQNILKPPFNLMHITRFIIQYRDNRANIEK